MSVFGVSSRVLTAGVALAAVVSAAGMWAAVGGVWGAGGPPSGYRTIELDDGEAAVAIGTPKDGVLETRWRDRDGSWSSPQRVDVPGAGSWSFMDSNVAGSTAAVHVFLYTPIDGRTGEPIGTGRVEAFVACSDGQCHVDVETAGVASPERPQLTAEGDTAYFGRSAEGYVVWRRGHGLGTERVSGLPNAGPGRSEPLLAPDGSFRVVQGAAAGGGCRMSLFTTQTTDTGFVEAVTFRRSPRASRPRCASSLDTVRSDSVTVTTSKSATPVFLAVRDRSWKRVPNDPSGLVHLVRKGRTVVGFSTRTGWWHNRELVIASPDGRRMIVQLRRKGATTWSPPKTIASIPRGPACWDIAPTSTIRDDPFYVTVRCRERPKRTADWVYSYVTAISDDGKTWNSVQGTDLPTLVGDDLLFKGHPSYRWSARTGLRQVALPVPKDADYSLLSDGTSVLTKVVRNAGGCALEVRLAAPDRTSWSTPVPDTTTGMPTGADCVLPHVQTEGTNAYFYYVVDTARTSLMDRMVRRDGAWQIEEGPRVG